MRRRRYLIAWLLVLSSVGVQARVMHDAEGTAHARSLQDYAAQDFCPDGCAEDGCIFAATSGGFRCQKCGGNLVVNKITGNCACPSGRWASSVNNCADCAKGTYCPGGDYSLGNNPVSPLKGTPDEGKLAPLAFECPLGSSGQRMTTLGRRTTTIRGCVNMPGSYYVISKDGSTVDQITCAANTYSPGLKKQRACVPCPPGFTTDGVLGASMPSQCVVPAGFYVKTPGQVAPCPRGEWKVGIGPAASCMKCMQGVTTPGEGSTSSSACVMVAAGYYASAMVDGVVTGTAVCPQGYWCPGGTPNRAFDPRSPDPDTLPPSGTAQTGTIYACPYGMLTVDLGATAAEQCLTPPGHYTDATGTYPCPSGHYRPDWLPYGDANTCISCGEGVKSAKTDQITRYDPVSNAPSQMAVTASDNDCYIMPGQGLYYTALTKSYRAKNCLVNSYGVSNTTYGLTPSPCRDCPANMVASRASTYPNSAQFYVKNGDAEGFADVRSCVTTDGYGYNGRGAQACDVGTYNGKDNWDSCKPCPYGYTTAGLGRGVSLASCGVAAGFGYSVQQQSVVPCPMGTYNNVTFTPGNSSACVDCGRGLTTEVEGAYMKDQCNMCRPGWGEAGCQTVCGGEGVNATYGPTGRSVETNPNCTVCTTQYTGYSFFDSAGKNDLYYSVPVTRIGASQSTDCVSKWSQLVDGAWHIPMPDNDPFSQTTRNVSTFAACVESCNYDPCEFVTYDYLTKSCTRRNGTAPVYVGAPLIAFKNLPSGDVGTNPWSLRASDAAAATADAAAGAGMQQQHAAAAPDAGMQPVRRNRAQLVSTGMYTFYREELALTVGTQEDPAKYGYNITAGLGDQFLQNCLDACDELGRCAGITVRMNVLVEDRPTTCKLIFGRLKLGVHKRTVMRADPQRMPLPSLHDFDDPAALPSPNP